MGTVAALPMGTPSRQGRSPARPPEWVLHPATRVGVRHFPEYQAAGDRVVSRPRQAWRVVSARTRASPQNLYQTGIQRHLARAGAIRSARPRDFPPDYWFPISEIRRF